MKYFPVIILLLLGLCNVALGRPNQKYTTKYDNIDINAILKNDRLMKNYVDCIMERKKCTKDGQELKKNIPDALRNDCASCSDFQKNGTRIVLKHIIKNKRDWFLEVEAKYDPTHIFRRTHRNDIEQEGVHDLF